ncbi:MAG TPA: methylenetetrahydrofolate reductase [Anaerolineales bacterium]|nr:methylenetetrahydrofolate reductase [Anaerolineales bacterium]
MKITERCTQQGDETLFICDYSPPKSGGPETWEPAKHLNAEYICVAYNPGKAVRVNSAALAYTIKQETGRDAIFNLSPRDMNKLALQSLLLGAQLLGLNNVLVLQGDPFTPKQLANVKDVSDFTSTGLMQAIAKMNEGLDYKGLKLDSPTSFCIGATMDLGRGIEHEASLAHRKVQAGAQFFLTQPVFSPATIHQILETYETTAGYALTQPIFWGVQIFVQGGVIFSSVPERIRTDLEKGRDGVEIALETLAAFREAGINRFYLIPPILKGGGRDYEAAQKMLLAVRA